MCCFYYLMDNIFYGLKYFKINYFDNLEKIIGFVIRIVICRLLRL